MSEYLTSKEVREILGISAATLWRWKKKGKIPYVQYGGEGTHPRYRRDDILGLIEGSPELAKSID